jgi:hypothetical protein
MDIVDETVSQVDKRDTIGSPQGWKRHHNGVNTACIVNASVRGLFPEMMVRREKPRAAMKLSAKAYTAKSSLR